MLLIHEEVTLKRVIIYTFSLKSVFFIHGWVKIKINRLFRPYMFKLFFIYMVM